MESSKDIEMINVDNGRNGQIQTKKLTEVTLKTHFYCDIFDVNYPFIFIGVPFNHVLVRQTPVKLCHHLFVGSWMMKVNFIGRVCWNHGLICCTSNQAYTILMLVLSHLILLAWIVYVAIGFVTSHDHLTNDLLFKLFRLSYILCGVIALDIVWIQREAIVTLITNHLDYPPILSNNSKLKTLYTKSTSFFTVYRYKMTAFKIFSRFLVCLFAIYLIYLIVCIVLTASGHQANLPLGIGTLFTWQNVLDAITVYSLYFFIAIGMFLVSIVWTIKYKLVHLNLFITNFTEINIGTESEDLIANPSIDDIELVKTWHVDQKICE